MMLTTGTRHGAGILDALARHGIRPDLVILERPRGRQLMSRVREMHRRRGILATIGAVARGVLGRLRPAAEPWRTAEFYEPRSGRLAVVESLAGEETAEVVRDLQPDLMVLGGAPILPAAILELPRIGTLNAHPGLLPKYRGVDVVAHAVLNGDPVGATVHFVDAGIDTGRIISRTEVPTRRGDTLASLQARVEAAGGSALAEAVRRLVADGSLAAETQTDRHPICRRLTRTQRRMAEARLREGG
ncbi:MAG: formyl transferase [Candidatus Limnocylindria bacterium]